MSLNFYSNSKSKIVKVANKIQKTKEIYKVEWKVSESDKSLIDKYEDINIRELNLLK